MKDFINIEQFEICTDEYYDDGYKVKDTNLVRDGHILGRFMRITAGYGMPYVTCLEANYNGTTYRTLGDNDEEALQHFIEQVNINIAHHNDREDAIKYIEKYGYTEFQQSWYPTNLFIGGKRK